MEGALAVGPTISTHVLDTERGQPAAGVSVELFRVDGDTQETLVGGGTTDDDGRVRSLLFEGLETATYRLVFKIDGAFFRTASVTFVVEDTSRSYHVPLLMAPYSLATYRGS
jgi:5-hydroxyisourate hydrolase